MLHESIFSPAECISVLAAISDTSKQLEVLYNSCLNKTIYFSKNLSSNLHELNNLTNKNVYSLQEEQEEEKSKRSFLQVTEKLMNLFKSLTDELNDYGTINCLEKYCIQQQDELDKLENFVNSAEENERYLNELQNDLQKLEVCMCNNTVEFTTTLTSLKHELQELEEISNMIEQYKKHDYDMRLQKELGIQSDEIKQLTDELDKVKLQTQQQARISEEINSWLYCNIARLENVAGYAAITYQSEYMNEKINNIVNELEQNKAMHAELERQQLEYEQIITADKREKDAKRIRDEYAQKFLMSVLQIQAWWRTMIEIRGIRLRKRKGKRKKK